MSNNSGKSSANHSSSGSAAELIRGVEQLIDSDQEQKNIKKLIELKMEFGVLKKIHPYMNNTEKLQLFMRDSQFRHRVNEKVNQKGFIFSSIPFLKVYLSTTRYHATVIEELDENDLLNVFGKFGQIQFLFVNGQTAFVGFQQIVSAYLALKILNQFEIDDFIRLTVKWATQEEANEAESLHMIKNQTNLNFENAGGSIYPVNNFGYIEKYVAKYEINVECLPEFNIAQRIIGPKGSYMKKILEKVINCQKNSKYNLQNIENILKIRLRGKGSNYIESSLGKQSDQRMHLCISSKQKHFYDSACRQIDQLFHKIFQQYKISYQKTLRRYPEGLAYRVLQSQANSFTQIKEVNLEQIESLDILTLSNNKKLTEKSIQEKILQREKARRMGLYKEADDIRNWLKQRGVLLVDQKGPRGKGKGTTWNYM